ncbi:MAG: acetyl/propionyl/methylcrotonyl-CoA carboxylase subunit alpha [Blastocatellia bacterium]
MNPFRKILIANRGEIAVRVIRTCRSMGIATVAVYSDADVNAPHVKSADEAVHVGASPSKESYLNVERIIEAADRTGAEAIHPGYGFLSEKAEFAEACAAAGIVFIGPSPAAIRQMGLKSTARRVMAAAGVPVVPGYDGDDQREATLRAEMLKIGFPVLIKASAGGGGKGMRTVRSESEIAEAVESARREAEKAFGDGALLLEKYVEHARHVEVQIFGDAHGNLVHLFERDCSLQRRHQKIIEESPSPAAGGELRRTICEAAVKVGRAINYTNAGTVEFILSPSGEFYFIEVNTRLQVEHPVTEMITRLDLVQLQIEIAEGKPLPFTQSDVRTRGHAIEARLYAEDPRNDFLPSAGTILDWRMPARVAGIRVDAGVEAGMEIGIHYDPMLAKLIAHAEDRDTAIRKLAYALKRSSIQGVKTNREFLLRLLEHPDFQAGDAHTGMIAAHWEQLLAGDEGRSEQASLVAAALYRQHRWRNSANYAGGLLAELPPAFRNNPYRDPSIIFQVDGIERKVSWRHAADNLYEVTVAGSTVRAQVLSCDHASIRLSLDGIQRLFNFTEVGDQLCVHSLLGSCEIRQTPRHPLSQTAAERGSANSPMPGAVLKLLVEAGQRVSAGDPLLILEAMKMEHTMRAAVDGVVEAILVKQGEIVAPGQLLVQISAT